MFVHEIKKFAFGFLALLGLINVGTAQLTYHTDANTNSFSLKTPSLQQSYTRFYGTGQYQRQQQLLQQQAQQQQLQQPTAAPVQYSQLAANAPQYQQYQPQQQQQYSGGQYATPLQQPQYSPTAASATASQESVFQPAASQYAQQFEALQRQRPQVQAQPAQQQYAQQLRSYYAQHQQQQQQQQLLAQQQQQQLLKQLYSDHPTDTHVSAEQQNHADQFFTAEQYATYLNSQHQQQQQQQQAFNEKQQYYSPPTDETHASTFMTTANPTPSSTTGPRNGLQYSAADQVSHVKFQSGNLSYNF